ncbi:hypothetical protein [Streptomyces caeruleatus]|uniref:hypothetical protein n=1 Tax=Streptomyces caeruleatus TaxID=661399 RepID=UPI000AB68A1D|nr:hypothetical protein [Streptomyces caeruleatus]
MMTNPDMVFSADPRHGLVARSGWEKEEARTVLRDLGWEWVEELHALLPPDDVPQVDAAVQAVAELHLHGHRTGYAVGPYGAMRLTLARAEQVFTKVAGRETSEARPTAATQNDQSTTAKQQQQSAYGDAVVSGSPVSPEGPGAPLI